MAGSRVSWGLLASLTLTALLQPIACVQPGPDTSISEETLALALGPVGPQIADELGQFEDALLVLQDAVLDWRAALDTQDGAVEIAVAREAYLDTMEVWQRLELLQIGPAGSSLTAVGGEDLRDEIYSWPDVVSGCRVDTETVEEFWNEADFISSNLVNSYGLDALEHLLFASTSTECPAQVDIQVRWDALGETGVHVNRSEYAAALVAHLLGVSEALELRWSGTLADAFAAGEAPWTSRVEALNALYDALFYLEIRTKDRKLGTPLGLRDCTVDCHLSVESQLSGASLRWIRANLVASRTLVQGGEADGLDALLAEVGHGDVAVALDAALADALVVSDGLTGPLDTLIVDEPAAVQALYDALKVVTDIIRGDLATVLLLEIPSEAAGDND